MNNDRIAAIRERCEKAAVCCWGDEVNASFYDIPDLLSEIDRLNAELAAYKQANPQKHGEWVVTTYTDFSLVDNYGYPDKTKYTCSVCGGSTGSCLCRYCPDCGAEMRKEPT